VAWSPDGTHLATASSDKTVRIWNPTTGTQEHELTDHTDWVTAVAWSPDGTHLATAAGNRVTLCDPTTGTQIRELTGRSDWVSAVAWSPNEFQLAAGTANGITAIWSTDVLHDKPAVELLPLAEGGWAAFGEGWHKISGKVNGEFWYVSGLCRFESGVLTPEQTGSRQLPPDAPLPMPNDN
jgi:WD40 repeat protein